MPFKSQTLKPAQYNRNHTSKASQFYKGFSTVNAEALDVKLYDYELIKQDLLNQFQIRKGERVMNPNFGSIIWDKLFEPFTEDVKNEIINDVTQIVTADPRASALSVEVIEQEYGLQLEITMQYSGTDQSEKLLFDFNKTNGLSVL
jgi:phage baseplate assembly protein W|tara:strand:+ start:82 stop:519 length:438 start_codon:yes stop_codon:yes gene_type:complete